MPEKVATHRHKGVDSPQIDFGDLTGLIKTVSVAPTAVPTKISEQFQLYINGATYRLYIYDKTNATWHYATLT